MYDFNNCLFLATTSKARFRHSSFKPDQYFTVNANGNIIHNLSGPLVEDNQMADYLRRLGSFTKVEDCATDYAASAKSWMLGSDSDGCEDDTKENWLGMQSAKANDIDNTPRGWISNLIKPPEEFDE